MENFISNLNVFVRLFQSINNLFCHVRWLERNVRNSSGMVLLIVGSIVFFAFYLMDGNSTLFESLGFGVGIDNVIRSSGPFIIVLLIVGLFLYRRQTLGAQTNGNSFDSVLFGHYDNDDNNNNNRNNNNNNNNDTKVYSGTPVSLSNQNNRKMMV